MFIGLARTFARELGIPVVCELTGEDIFLDAMGEADRAAMQKSIRSASRPATPAEGEVTPILSPCLSRPGKRSMRVPSLISVIRLWPGPA